MNPRLDDPLREPTEIAREYLRSHRGKVDGVVCAADFLGVGMLRAAREEGVDVPGELSVISLSDNVTGSADEVPMTAFQTPVEEMGAKAFELLHATVTKEITHPVEEQIRGEIVVRKSA